MAEYIIIKPHDHRINLLCAKALSILYMPSLVTLVDM